MNAYKQLMIAVLAMTVVIIIGTIGFMLLEELSFFKSLWMTMITVLTVGYGDAIPTTIGGRIFAMLIIPLGIGIATYAIGAVTALIIEGDIFHVVGRRKMDRNIAKLKEHVIVCGYGRVGAQVAEELKRKEIPFVVIDRSAEALQGKELLFLVGDATEDETLLAAGIERASGLIAALPQDAENVFVTLTARGLHAEIKIVARAERANAEEKLRRAGANKVINPASMAGRRIAMDLILPTSMNYIDTVLHGTKETFGLEEIRIAEHSSLAGKTLQENDIRMRFDVTVLAILRKNTVIHNPTREEKLQKHDMIIVFGSMEKLKKLEQACQFK